MTGYLGPKAKGTDGGEKEGMYLWPNCSQKQRVLTYSSIKEKRGNCLLSPVSCHLTVRT